MSVFGDFEQEFSRKTGEDLNGFVPDGKFHRIGKNKHAWAIGFRHLSADKEVVVVKYGSWKDGKTYEWKNYTRDEMPKEERIKIANKLRAIRELKLAEEARHKAEVADSAKNVFKQAVVTSLVHPYLADKGIKSNYCARILDDKLLVPLFLNNSFRTYQVIYRDGDRWGKKFPSGSGKKGSFSFVDPTIKSSRAFVSEGFATACSVQMAFPSDLSVFAVDCGNLELVVKTLLLACDEIIVCADNDSAGISAAKACLIDEKVRMVRPDDGFGNDFNDVHVEHSIGKVRAMIESGIGLEDKDVVIDYGFERTRRGDIIENVNNVIKFLSKNPTFQNKIHYDEFQMRIFFESPDGKREWNDNDDLKLMQTLQATHGMHYISDMTANKAVRFYAHKNKINSVVKYFDSLSWDGVSRIERYFVDYMSAEDNEYVRRAGNNFFISMVARAYQPGCKVDNMVILEGPQGQKKSTANSILVGDQVFSEVSESIESKDFLLSLQGKLLVEIAELDSFSKAEMTRVKQVITNRIDRYRAPYGRATMDVPRTCVFVGTTNEDTYLNDVTGGRRFWPIKINEINLEAINLDRDQLFAEAVSLYKRGYSWWEMPLELTAQAQEDRRVVDEFEILIQDYLHGKVEVTLWGVAMTALNIDKQRLDVGIQRRIGRCLRANGFKSVTRRDGEEVIRLWEKTTKSWRDKCNSSVSANTMFPRSK